MSECVIPRDECFSENKPLLKIFIPERIKGTDYFNFTGLSMQELFRFFPHDLKAKKVVLLPDFTPNKTGLLPSGCSVEIDTTIDPKWRRFAVSDIGCGMQVLKSPSNWEYFEENLGLWDQVSKRLLDNKGSLGDLGSGNHFLDAAVDADEQLYFVIHTGSRYESEKATELIDNPDEFDAAYAHGLQWARQNRDAISTEIEEVYGNLDLILDKPHNFYLVDEGKNKAVIYKGAVSLKPGELNIIPSSMDGDMALVQSNVDLKQINHAMLHGTGRTKSRSDCKEGAKSYAFKSLRERIYIPHQIRDASLASENPSCYRSLDECLELLYNIVDVKDRLTPIAYIGQL